MSRAAELPQGLKLERKNYQIKDFCAERGIGRSTVYKEIAAGRLKPFKVGKRTLISVQAAEEWDALVQKPRASKKGA